MRLSRNAKIYGETSHLIMSTRSSATRYRSSASTEAIDKCVLLVVMRNPLVALAERDSSRARRLWSLAVGDLSEPKAICFSSQRAPGSEWHGFSLRWPSLLANGRCRRLSVSRPDIANYLGLTRETVSCTLTHLETKAAIALATSRQIELCIRETLLSLNDTEGQRTLTALASLSMTSQPPSNSGISR
jgi:CRP-like cAMP-binding protein